MFLDDCQDSLHTCKRFRLNFSKIRIAMYINMKYDNKHTI